MNDDSTPLERLRAANPVPTPDAAWVSSPVAVALLNRIVALDPSGLSPAPPPLRTGRRRLVRRIVPAVVVAMLAGTVAYSLLTGSPSKFHTIACYQRADLGARTEVRGADARGPEAACADLWAAGVFGDRAVPLLVACVLESGAVGVFPSTAGVDECQRLGLVRVSAAASTSTSTPGPTSTGPAPAVTTGPAAAPAGDVTARFLAFRDVVLAQFADAACVEPEAGRAIVRRELDRAGLNDWTIRVLAGGGFSAERPCATLGFDPAGQAVVLVPAPPRR